MTSEKSVTTTASAWLQLWGVTRIFAADFRELWPSILLFSIFTPLGLLWFMGSVATRPSLAEALHLLGGNLVASIAFGPSTYMLSRLGWARHNREMDYFAMLPLSKFVVLGGLFVVGLGSALPGIASILIFGSLMLNLPLKIDLLTLGPTVVLTALSLGSVAALLGTWVKDGVTANIAGNVMVLLVTFLSPVLAPLERFPTILRWFSMILPPTYAASVLQHVLAGEITAGFWLDISILSALTLLCVWLVGVKLKWRGSL